MGDLIFGKLVDYLIKIVHKSIAHSDVLPLLKTEVWFHSDESSSAQLFYLHVSNRSNKDILIDQALLVKRNIKFGTLITFNNAEIYLPNEILIKSKLNHENIIKQFANLKPLNNVCIKAKSSIQLAVHLQLDAKTHEHWKNFEFGIIPGFVSEDGRVFPSWRAPRFPWEVLIKDEMNFYWTLGQEIVPYQVYLERYRILLPIKSKLDRGETLGFWDIIKYKWFIFKKQLKYLGIILLLKFSLRNNLPEQL